jgi:phosphoenolpyruvate synthase/pyruvate phosphate dikinase
MYTKTFSEISRADVAEAGGKGAFLGELTQNEICVPPGFVILTNTFSRFLDSLNLSAQIQEAFIALRQGAKTAETVSDEITKRILEGEIPEDISMEIIDQHKKLETKFVAVRSSATAEDNAENSWAGQLESFLNVTDETLLQRVKQCWASLFSKRAIAYRLHQTKDDDLILVAVVIQKMVNPEVAGIAFSVDPVTENTNAMIIEAVYGLGESIVQGEITPDHYSVLKASLSITDIFQSSQERGIYLMDDLTTGWKNIDPEFTYRQKLDSSEIIKLAGFITSIEQIAGFYCDIEWALHKGQFFILQCRPVTTM